MTRISFGSRLLPALAFTLLGAASIVGGALSSGALFAAQPTINRASQPSNLAGPISQIRNTPQGW